MPPPPPLQPRPPQPQLHEHQQQQQQQQLPALPQPLTRQGQQPPPPPPSPPPSPRPPPPARPPQPTGAPPAHPHACVRPTTSKPPYNRRANRTTPTMITPGQHPIAPLTDGVNVGDRSDADPGSSGPPIVAGAGDPASHGDGDVVDGSGGSDGDFVCAACVGALGLYGNSLLQLVGCWLLARRSGLRLLLPEAWSDRYGPYFPAVAALGRMQAERAYALPLVADRVVLSHPGWRAWAQRHPTTRQLAAQLLLLEQQRPQRPQRPGQGPPTPRPRRGAQPAVPASEVLPAQQQEDQDCRAAASGAATARAAAALSSALVGESGAIPEPAAAAALSGRQLRAHFPQVCGDDLEAEPARLRERLRGRGLWGWFQFPASLYSAHQAEVRGLLALQPSLERQLRGAMAAVMAAAGASMVEPEAVAAELAAAAGQATAGHSFGVADGWGGSVGCRIRSISEAADTGDGRSCGLGSAGTGGAAPNVGDTGGGSGGDSGGSGQLCRTHGGGRRRRRLVVLHLRQGDFRELLGPPPEGEARSRTTATATVGARVGAAGDCGLVDGSVTVVLPTARQGPVPSHRSTAASSSPSTPTSAATPWPCAPTAPPSAIPDSAGSVTRRVSLTTQGGDAAACGARGDVPWSTPGPSLDGAAPAAEPQAAAAPAALVTAAGAAAAAAAALEGVFAPDGGTAGVGTAGGRMREAPPFESDGQQGYAWRDRSGVDFRVPLSWYGAALEALPYDPAADLLWVCSDDAQLAARPQICGLEATSWTAVLRRCSEAASSCAAGAAAACSSGAALTGCGIGSIGTLPAVDDRHAGPGRQAQRPLLDAEQVQLLSQHPLLADWYVMRVADVLLSSNSTLSYTAALLNQPFDGGMEALTRHDSDFGIQAPPASVRHGHHDSTAAAAAPQEQRPCGSGVVAGGPRQSGPAALLLRPDPALGRLRPFDPWAELPLLPSAPVPANHSLRQRPLGPSS